MNGAMTFLVAASIGQDSKFVLFVTDLYTDLKKIYILDLSTT